MYRLASYQIQGYCSDKYDGRRDDVFFFGICPYIKGGEHVFTVQKHPVRAKSKSHLTFEEGEEESLELSRRKCNLPAFWLLLSQLFLQCVLVGIPSFIYIPSRILKGAVALYWYVPFLHPDPVTQSPVEG